MTPKKQDKILIADDNDQDRLELIEILKDEFAIIEAADRNTCLDLLCHDNNIAAVLFNISASCANMFSLLEELVSSAEINHVPVIVISDDNSSHTELSALKSGAVEFLKKPYNPDVVKCRVNNILSRKILRNNVLEKELDNVNESLSAMVDLVPDGIAIYDIHSDGRITMELSNKYFEDIFNLGNPANTHDLCTLDDILKFVHPSDYEETSQLIKNSLKNKASLTCEYRIVLEEEQIKWIRMSLKIIRHENDTYRCHALFADVTTERERESQITAAFDELKYMTSHDSLTQLYNRDTFFSHTAKMLKDKPNKKYTLVMCDIKNFKVVNDLFGNENGNRILIRMAEKIKNIASDTGTYGRLRADKFAFCIPTTKFNINSIITDMDIWLNNSGIINYAVKVFFGIYDISDNINIPVNLMCDRAGLALKNAKLDYVNRYAYYDAEMRQSVIDEEEILSEMENALSTGQFKICYQPIFSITSGKPVSAEALVRWVHPEKGIISPLKFITVFENNKFITKLDKYVFEEVCKFQRACLDRGETPIPISVNFSRLDCYMPRICEDVLEMVEKYNLTTDMIKIEITESAYTNDKEQIISVAERLQSYGFSILMDDFGSGYSSLNILKDVKVDVLKIDKKFIDDMNKSEMGGAIVSSVVRMARLIGIDVIAEGVEDQYQIDFLRGIGCDTIQGYYYSQPLFESDFLNTLNKYNGMTDSERISEFKNNNVNLEYAWNMKDDINSLFDGLVGALGLYELSDGVLEVVRVNDEYYELFGATPQSVYSDLGQSFSRLTEDGQNDLIEACSRAKYKNEIACIELRRHHQDGHMMWISCRVKYIGRNDNRDMFYILINDITERKREDAQRQMNVYADVFKTFFNAIFEFNTTKRTVTVLYEDGSIGFETGEKYATEDFQRIFLERAVTCENPQRFKDNQKSFYDSEDMFVDIWRFKNKFGELQQYQRRLIKIKDSDDEVYLSCLVDISSESCITTPIKEQ